LGVIVVRNVVFGITPIGLNAPLVMVFVLSRKFGYENGFGKLYSAFKVSFAGVMIHTMQRQNNGENDKVKTMKIDKEGHEVVPALAGYDADLLWIIDDMLDQHIIGPWELIERLKLIIKKLNGDMEMAKREKQMPKPNKHPTKKPKTDCKDCAYGVYEKNLCLNENDPETHGEICDGYMAKGGNQDG